MVASSKPRPQRGAQQPATLTILLAVSLPTGAAGLRDRVASVHPARCPQLAGETGSPDSRFTKRQQRPNTAGAGYQPSVIPCLIWHQSRHRRHRRDQLLCGHDGFRGSVRGRSGYARDGSGSEHGGHHIDVAVGGFRVGTLQVGAGAAGPRPPRSMPVARRYVGLRSGGAVRTRGRRRQRRLSVWLHHRGRRGHPLPYYGAADTSLALATGSIRQLLRWLDEHGSPLGLPEPLAARLGPGFPLREGDPMIPRPMPQVAARVELPGG